MAAPSPMAAALQKGRERFFPKLTEYHTKLKANPIIITMDTGMFMLGVAGVVTKFYTPVHQYVYHKVTGELPKDVNEKNIMNGLPNRVTTLENKVSSLESRHTTLDSKVREIESMLIIQANNTPEPTVPTPVYNTPSSAARNIIRRATKAQ